jgi:hypothetical protein
MSFISEANPDPPVVALSTVANESMWDALHLGNYDSIPSVLRSLEVAYEAEPHNVSVTAHLGFVHLWAFAERGRTFPNPEITKHVYKSNRYFKEAVAMDPYDPRFKGFQSATQFCEAALDKNIFGIAKGYLKGKKAIREWPQFNAFALSLMESQGKKRSLMFREGLKYQWKLFDDCSCSKLTEELILEKTDSVMTALVAELKASDDDLVQRACWNTWIAPHNLEGFLLNFGDMLVKAGRLEDAQKIYNAASYSPNFNDWVYKDVISDRIKNVELNYVLFNRKADIFNASADGQIFINSDISCVSCHQMSQKEYALMGRDYPDSRLYTIK